MSNIDKYQLQILFAQLKSWAHFVYGFELNITEAQDQPVWNIIVHQTVEGAYSAIQVSIAQYQTAIIAAQPFKDAVKTVCEGLKAHISNKALQLNGLQECIDGGSLENWALPKDYAGAGAITYEMIEKAFKSAAVPAGNPIGGSTQTVKFSPAYGSESTSKPPKSITEMYTMPPKVKAKAKSKSKLKLTATELQTLAENKAAGEGIFAPPNSEQAFKDIKWEKTFNIQCKQPALKHVEIIEAAAAEEEAKQLFEDNYIFKVSNVFNNQPEPPNSAAELSNKNIKKSQLKPAIKLSHKK